MKNISIKNFIFVFFTLVFSGFLFAPATSAVISVDNLVVEFENTPLFSEANFIPGDGVTRWIKVTNNSPDVQDIIIEAINFSDSGSLGDNLELTIKEGSAKLYQDTMANFFSRGEIFLSALAGNGGSTQYDLNVKFPEGADSSLMEDNLSFDILIGFSGNGDGGEGNGNNGGGEDNGVVISGGGGGSQGTSGYRGLIISNEAIFDIIAEAGTAEAFWNTSYPATSQVVYGLTSAGPYTLNLNDPKFGYPFATLEDSLKVTEHYVDLFGLIPGETYSYRVISHASPPTVSFEHTFTVPLLNDSNSQNINLNNEFKENQTIENQSTEKQKNQDNILSLASEPPRAPGNPIFFDPKKEKKENELTGEDEAVNKPQTQEKTDKKALASIFSAFSLDKLFSSECVDYSVYLLILFIIAYFLRFLWEKKNKKNNLSKNELTEKRILYLIKVAAALLLLEFIFKISCLGSILLLILTILIVWYFLNKRKNTSSQ